MVQMDPLCTNKISCVSAVKLRIKSWSYVEVRSDKHRCSVLCFSLYTCSAPQFALTSDWSGLFTRHGNFQTLHHCRLLLFQPVLTNEARYLHFPQLWGTEQRRRGVMKSNREQRLWTETWGWKIQSKSQVWQRVTLTGLTLKLLFCYFLQLPSSAGMLENVFSCSKTKTTFWVLMVASFFPLFSNLIGKSKLRLFERRRKKWV